MMKLWLLASSGIMLGSTAAGEMSEHVLRGTDWANTGTIGGALLLLGGVIAWVFKTHLPKMQKEHLDTIKQLQKDQKEMMEAARKDWREAIKEERDEHRQTKSEFLAELRAERALREETTASTVQLGIVTAQLKDAVDQSTLNAIKLHTFLVAHQSNVFDVQEDDRRKEVG